MKEILVSGLYLVAGACLYAAFHQLSIGLRRPRNHTHLLFGGMCLSMAVFSLALGWSYRADTVTRFIPPLKCSLAAAALFFVLFPSFIAAYTGVRPRLFLMGSTVLFAVLFAVNLVRPYGLQFDDIQELKRLPVPWDERLVQPVGRISLWYQVAVPMVFATCAFAFYALGRLYYRTRRRSTFIMMLAVGLFVITTAEGTLVRMYLVEFVFLAPFGYLAMIIAMGLTLSHETQERIRASERRFRALVEQSPFSIQMLSPKGRTIMVNPAWEQLWGAKLETLAGYNLLEDPQLIAKGAMPYVKRAFAGEAAEIPPLIYNPAENPVAAGPYCDRWIRGHIYPIKDDNGRVADVILMHEDVTEKKYVEDTIRQIAAGVSAQSGQLFFRELVRHLAKLFDADYALIGMQAEGCTGDIRTLAVCAHGEIVENFRYPIAGTPCAEVLGQGTSIYPREVRRRFPDSPLLTETQAEGYIGTPLYSASGRALGFIAVIDSKPLHRIEQIRDILGIFAARAAAELERMDAEAQIHRMVYQDRLTELANRTALQERLKETGDSARQSAILLIDLDHFKTINDALGHNVGDEVLLAVAHRLCDTVDGHGLIARLGGDEFVAVMDDLAPDEAEATAAAEKLAREIATDLAEPIVLGERVLNVGASIGATLFHKGRTPVSDILRRADMALYRAKSLGRGNIQFFLPSLQAAADRRLCLERGLRTALAKNQLAVYFQPQVSATGQVFGAEALLRWHHPDLGMVSPAAFIPIAEETGLIHAIGEWVLRKACDGLAAWAQAGIRFTGHLSVNLSPWQFARPDFARSFHGVLAERGTDPGRLVLEVTESALLYDVHETIDKLTALRAAGFRVSLDDFGTGYSSLAYLKDLPLDILKIDKAFVDELKSNNGYPIVDAIITLGRRMNLTVIAEGVETESQRKLLVESGCTSFQGYLFCRPLPEDEFLCWLGKAAG